MKQEVWRAPDFWAGIGLVIIGAIWLKGALDIYNPRAFSDMLGPRAFPLGLSASVAVLGIVILIRAIKVGDDPADPGRLRTLGFLALTIIGYALAFLLLGFVISTVLFMVVQFRFLGERRHWLNATVSVGVTMALYLGFVVGLRVDLPQGPLGF
ncbi:MAG: tripartite tricarboxylate transporter TctB family protein [Chloroflexota bacterium]